MRTPTIDTNVFIIEEMPDRKVYESTLTGKQWEILGTCNMCGLCEVGGHDPDIVWNSGIEPGQPNACYYNNPNRLPQAYMPEIKIYIPQCQLSGNYL